MCGVHETEEVEEGRDDAWQVSGTSGVCGREDKRATRQRAVAQGRPWSLGSREGSKWRVGSLRMLGRVRESIDSSGRRVVGADDVGRALGAGTVLWAWSLAAKGVSG